MKKFNTLLIKFKNQLNKIFFDELRKICILVKFFLFLKLFRIKCHLTNLVPIDTYYIKSKLLNTIIVNNNYIYTVHIIIYCFKCLFQYKKLKIEYFLQKTTNIYLVIITIINNKVEYNYLIWSCKSLIENRKCIFFLVMFIF